MIDKLYTAEETAELLKINSKSLATMRSKGRGPKWIKLGGTMLRYREEDIHNYIQEAINNVNN